MATIKDVAREAGVSVALVSRYMNGKPGVGSDSARAIAEAVERLHYHPNQLARSLVMRGTRVWAVIADSLSDPETAAHISVFARQAEKAGYYAAFLSAENDPARKTELLAAFGSGRADGVILLGDTDASEIAVGSLSVPVVSVLGNVRGTEVHTLSVDREAGGRVLTEYMLRIRPWICYLRGGEEDAYEAGYRAAVTARVGEDHIHAVNCGLTREDGYSVMKRLLARGIVPNGILARNSEVATGAARAYAEHGRRIPRDVIAAVLEGEEKHEGDTVFTTLCFPWEEAAAKAAELLTRGSENDGAACGLLLEPKVLCGESTRRKNG